MAGQAGRPPRSLGLGWVREVARSRLPGRWWCLGRVEHDAYLGGECLATCSAVEPGSHGKPWTVDHGTSLSGDRIKSIRFVAWAARFV